LVLLVCVGVGYLVLKSVHDSLATPGQIPILSSQSPSGTQTPAARPLGYRKTLQAAKFQLQVEIEPATTGANVVHLYAFTTTGRQLKVDEWKATATPPAAGAEWVNAPVLKLSENHAVGTVSLPVRGKWQFQFTLRTAEGEDSVTTDVPIR
jgi:copper transport protein